MMPTITNPDFSRVMFLPGTTMQEYLEAVREQHPSLYERIDIDRLDPEELSRIYSALDGFGSAFDGKEKGGRGDAYRNTQLAYPLVRAQGISRLCEMATPADATPGPDTFLLDAFGGSGTVTRAIRLLRSARSAPTIVTGDIAAPMIERALAYGLPAVRQSIERWLLKDASLDGVIFAYGTHHLPVGDRPRALAETYRVLRPGGHVVVHDFEEGTPTARWYSEVLDRYTDTGHKHEHFVPDRMHDLLVNAGFRDVHVRYLYDPCVVFGESPEAARRDVLEYMVNLFALTRLMREAAAADEDPWEKAEAVVREYATFSSEECHRYGAAVGELTVRPYETWPSMNHSGADPADNAACSESRRPERRGGPGTSPRQFRAELPRVALVGTGIRP